MKQRLEQLSSREWILTAATILLVVFFVAGKLWIIPVYDRWVSVRSTLKSQSLEYAKLKGFLRIQDQVHLQYEDLQSVVFQSDTDEITLSRFLKQLESLARMPSMTIINAKPQPVEDLGSHRNFPIRLAVSGTLPEVTRFVTSLLNGPDIVTLQGYSIRGVQGGRLVECSLTVKLVTLAKMKSTEYAEQKLIEKRGSNG